jgi:arylsulfatase A-like enzyme
VPATLTADQVREVNALNAVEVELIDEAVGRVLRCIEDKGWGDDVDVVFTTDHGEFQGDFGFLFKGPYHVDALMRLPLIWRPARVTKTAPGVVTAPVSLVSLAATFLSVAGQPAPAWVEGDALPQSDDEARTRGHDATVTEWDSSLFGVDVHVRTVLTKDHLYTEYAKGTLHEGTEGELYDLRDDPLQRVNLFSDPSLANLRATLHERLRAHEDRPGERATPGIVMAPV